MSFTNERFLDANAGVDGLIEAKNAKNIQQNVDHMRYVASIKNSERNERTIYIFRLP